MNRVLLRPREIAAGEEEKGAEGRVAGSDAYFFVPTASASVRPAVPDAVPTSSILIVDDEPANLLTLEAVLEPLAQKIVTAESGEEAIALCEEREFAVILLDVRLPGMNGVEAAAVIKTQSASKFTPIIFLTAERGDGSFAAKSYRYGAVDYVTKPYDPEILRSKVAVFVELFARGQQIKQQEARLRQKEREAVERESREKVRWVEERLRAVIAHAPIILFALDPEGKFTLSEGSGLAELGLRPGEVVGTSVYDLYPGVMADDVRRALAGEEFSSQVVLNPVGIAHEILWVPVWDERGHVREVIGVATNVSERVRSEAEKQMLLERERAAHREAERQRERLEQLAADLSNQQKWLETIMNMTPTPLLLIEPVTANVIFANRAADAMAAGSFPKDRRGDPPRSSYFFSDEAGRRIPLEGLPGVRDKGDLRGVELFWHTPEGRRTLVTYSASVPAMAHHASIAVVSFVDVTKLKEIELELGASVRARDDFLSIASHELNTPLTPLKMHIGRLQRRIGLLEDGSFVAGRGMDAETVARSLDLIDRQVDRVTKLVGELLDVSRITAGQLRLELEPVDLRGVADEVAARFAEDATRSGSRITVEGDPSAVGSWDKLRVEQVVTNLVSNAVKYGAGRPIEVTVRVLSNPNVAELVVRDRGIGIPLDQQARIFDRFERAVSSRHYGGFGLGLWIVRQIVEASGGSVRVESLVGDGSTFTVELPFAPGVTA